jgi:hypothetical protein
MEDARNVVEYDVVGRTDGVLLDKAPETLAAAKRVAANLFHRLLQTREPRDR